MGSFVYHLATLGSTCEDGYRLADYFYKDSRLMSTAKDTAVNTKLNTIQPIEGAKGNIALYYYQGKYPIYKSLDDNMYHLKSVMDAYKASTDKDFSKNDISHWRELKKTDELVNYFRERGFPRSQVLLQKRQQNNNFRYLDGWYANEEMMLDFAGWLNVCFKVEIYHCFARQAEIDRLNADIDHKQTTIDELRADMKKLLSKNDELLQINRDQTDTLNKMRKDMKTIKANSEAAAPIASSLKNRVSSPLSEEYLLINYTENGNTIDVQYKAVNPNTIKRERLNVESFWIHQSFANSVDAQNRLLDILSDKHILLKLDRRTKTFMIRPYHLNKLRSIVENDLYESLNVESTEISDIVSEITDKANETPIEMFMGYPKDYCIKVCDRWHINLTILAKIIDKKGRYQRKYPIRLHPTDGLVYRQNVNGKTVLYKLPTDAFGVA